jgi:choice-of-anchor A domain-containing protein
MTARRLTLIAAAAATLMAGSAHAATSLTSKEALQQFNVIALNNYTTSSHVQGRTFVGNDLIGNGAVLSQNSGNMLPSVFAGVTVMGNISGTTIENGGVYAGSISNSTVNNGSSYIKGNSTNTSYNGSGNYYAGGTVSGGNRNQTKSDTANALQTGYKDAALTSAVGKANDMANIVNNFSSYLSTLKSTGSTVAISSDQHTVTFNAVADSRGLAVFDLTKIESSVFNSTVTDFKFNMNGALGAVFNTNDSAISLNANMNRTDLGGQLIWNFAGATSVTTTRTMDGQILVPTGTFSNLNTNVEGGVYAYNIVSTGEIHQVLMSAPVPEPETYAMMLAGLAVMGAVVRRRRKQQ